MQKLTHKKHAFALLLLSKQKNSSHSGITVYSGLYSVYTQRAFIPYSCAINKSTFCGCLLCNMWSCYARQATDVRPKTVMCSAERNVCSVGTHKYTFTLWQSGEGARGVFRSRHAWIHTSSMLCVAAKSTTETLQMQTHSAHCTYKKTCENAECIQSREITHSISCAAGTACGSLFTCVK